MFFGIVTIFVLLAVVIAIPGSILWLWMLIDCIKNEKPGAKEKRFWIIVMILTGAVGALIYLFSRRPYRHHDDFEEAELIDDVK